jgi:hypothetical protein
LIRRRLTSKAESLMNSIQSQKEDKKKEEKKKILDSNGAMILLRRLKLAELE